MVVSKENRAKQFQPFDSLKGLQEALRKKEKEHDEEVEKEQGIKEDVPTI
ncbi:MAG: hypothetical protein IJH76_03805 [Clostridia bacterium]|nr:hypothetical protein [Clostridia bacterium]